MKQWVSFLSSSHGEPIKRFEKKSSQIRKKSKWTKSFKSNQTKNWKLKTNIVEGNHITYNTHRNNFKVEFLILTQIVIFPKFGDFWNILKI